MKLSHIGIMVNDLYKMTLFYKKVFGFKEVYSYSSKNTRGLKTVFLNNNSITIELLHVEGSRVGENKNIHISFEVDDVDAEFDRLRNLGVNIVSGVRNTGDGYREGVIKDPENNTIEVSKRVTSIPNYKVEAVIFDLDGTIIDSEDNYYEADRILLGKYGINFTQDMKLDYIGTGNHSMMVSVKDRFGIDETVQQLLRLKNDIYLDIARKHTRVYAQMREFLEILHEQSVPMALASGSSPEILDELTTTLGLKKYFKFIVSAEDVEKGKPEPDIFLLTAKKLGVSPENCVVVEDSKYGVEAAKRAFMRCIAVPYITTKPLEDPFITADLLFEDGMKSFDPVAAYNFVSSF